MSFLRATGLSVYCEGLGDITVDVAYGGNFYAIIEAQQNFSDMDEYAVQDLLTWSPRLRTALNEKYEFVHPEQTGIRGLTHIMWTGAAKTPGATARNAVFYGDKAIDRSPCGTGTSARMAQWQARGQLLPGDKFIHESIIGSCFTGKIETMTKVGDRQAIVPSIGGAAYLTGFNRIIIDERDPFAHGFVVQ